LDRLHNLSRAGNENYLGTSIPQLHCNAIAVRADYRTGRETAIRTRAAACHAGPLTPKVSLTETRLGISGLTSAKLRPHKETRTSGNDNRYYDW